MTGKQNEAMTWPHLQTMSRGIAWPPPNHDNNPTVTLILT